MASRRKFLKKALTGLFGTGLLLSPFFSMVRHVAAEALKIIVPKGTKRETLVDKNPKDLDTSHLEITRTDDFGVMGLEDHEVNLETWMLRVEGGVERPLHLRYPTLLEMPSVERAVLLICPGVFANHGLWRGVSVKELLGRAGMAKEVNYITFRGPEGRYEKVLRVPISDVLSDQVFLAHHVNGAPLPMKHGFPLRVVAEGYYGYDWVKYVDKVTADVIPEPAEAHSE
ncbi:MAG: molybdopterin-dependent oxidoreductase [Desulfomonile tiedjei]|nr:molybdopterin-dependent oxidoreductase [Desulfomonile tiedjei]